MISEPGMKSETCHLTASRRPLVQKGAVKPTLAVPIERADLMALPEWIEHSTSKALPAQIVIKKAGAIAHREASLHES